MTALGKKFSLPPASSSAPLARPHGRGSPSDWATQRKASPPPLWSCLPVPQPQPTEWTPWLLAASIKQVQGPGQAPSLGPLSWGSQMAVLPLGAHPLQGRSVKTRVSSSPSGALQSTSSPTNLTLTPFWLKLGGGTNDWAPGLRGEYHNLAKHTRVESATDKGTS